MKLTSTSAFVAADHSNPGDQHSGPSHPPSHLDHLPTPWGTVGKTETEVFRRLCHRMDIPESHTAGRSVLLDHYALKLRQKGNAASDKAIREELNKYKD